MRARNLKPGLFKNEKLGSADPLLTILFEGLWCMSDREGRLEDRPLRICAEVFPYRRSVTEKKVDTYLDWLQREEFISRYEVGGLHFIQVLKFLEHNNPHKNERPSQIPPLSSRSHPASTGQEGESLGKKPVVARLNPSSLNPESGILNPESSLREARATGAGGGQGTGSPSEAFELVTAIRTVYPAGTYRGSNWILAERAISKLLEAGEPAELILAHARAFRVQQDAKGSTGTQYVLSPEKFFGPDGHWRGPFPLPIAAVPKDDSNHAALLQRLSRAGA